MQQVMDQEEALGSTHIHGSGKAHTRFHWVAK